MKSPSSDDILTERARNHLRRIERMSYTASITNTFQEHHSNYLRFIAKYEHIGRRLNNEHITAFAQALRNEAAQEYHSRTEKTYSLDAALRAQAAQALDEIEHADPAHARKHLTTYARLGIRLGDEAIMATARNLHERIKQQKAIKSLENLSE